MSVFKVDGSLGSQSQTITFEEIRYSGQCFSVPKVSAATPPANGLLLLEDGFYLLQEDASSKIILQP